MGRKASGPNWRRLTALYGLGSDREHDQRDYDRENVDSQRPEFEGIRGPNRYQSQAKRAYYAQKKHKPGSQYRR